MAVYFYETGSGYQPTTPNVAYTRLGTMVASNDTAAPQYQYVMDVYESGSSEYIVRMVQTPNDITQSPFDTDTVIFDPSRIFQGELDFDNNWKVTGSIAPDQSVKTFELKIGEQYGTSPSSSITVYPNQASMSIEVFPGVVNPTDNSTSTVFGNAWNFNTSSFVESSNILSNNPEATTIGAFSTIGPDTLILLGLEDYYTITLLDIPQNSVARIFWVGPSGFVHIETIPANTKFNTIGIGPKNLIEYNPAWEAYFNDPAVTYVSVIGVATSLISAPNFSYSIKGKANDIQCGDEITKFSFINRYGFWDYYNVYNPVRTTTALERKNYNKPQLLSRNGGFITPQYYGAYTGWEQFYLRSTDTYSIDTDYITKETADWLEELLESPEVYLQEGSDFVPIVLTNSSYEHNNSTSRNKLFQYTIEWVYANPRRSRL
jgi:hypothetical protein